MGRAWSGEAHAKVNLRLRVFEREDDGYHRIDTVFHALELSDVVELELVDEAGARIEIAGLAEGALGPPEKNLAVVAARRFQDALSARDPRSEGFPSGRGPGVRIRLEKRIPHGAGLGGGSSDAATVLRGLNALHGEPFDQDALLVLGGAIGSDVPFFLTGAARARAGGRGERLRALPPLPAREVHLAVPSPPVSTAWAYRMLDEARQAEGRHEGPEPPVAEADWGATIAAAVNDFERVLFPLRPDLARAKDELLRRGAALALLSGSGSAVFGIFEGPAGTAAHAAPVEGFPVIATRTLAPGIARQA